MSGTLQVSWMLLQETNEQLTAELAKVSAKASSDLARAKQHAAEMSEDLEAANRELEVLQAPSHCFPAMPCSGELICGRIESSADLKDVICSMLPSMFDLQCGRKSTISWCRWRDLTPV